jgi:hypothetical protein
MLILAIAEDFNKLFQDCCLASVTSLRKLSGVVIVTIDLAVVLVITILRPEYCRAYRAGEMVDVIFAIEGRDVRST